jgi:hypothetical protein
MSSQEEEVPAQKEGGSGVGGSENTMFLRELHVQAPTAHSSDLETEHPPKGGAPHNNYPVGG